nr:uncharacterized protein LOC117990495 [Maniola hyperantus]
MAVSPRFAQILDLGKKVKVKVKVTEMPDTLSLSAGVSLGLLAGIVSGVCYLFANGLTRPLDERKEYRKRCVAPKENNICIRCGGDQLGGPVPCICLEHRPVKFESGAWCLRQAQRALSLMPWAFSTDRLEQIDEEECEGPSSSEGRGDLHNVREFLEAISARLSGGPLEGTRVAPLYDHPAYVSMFERHHAALRDTLAALTTALRDALKRKIAPSMQCGTSTFVSMFERHHAALRDTLAALTTALRDALKRKIAPSMQCGTSTFVSMFERHHAALRDTLAALTTALRDALKRKIAPSMQCGTSTNVSMFERHHAALRDTLAALTTALRDALKRKIAPSMQCGTSIYYVSMLM